MSQMQNQSPATVLACYTRAKYQLILPFAMPFLTASQRQTLSLICDTLVPPLDAQPSDLFNMSAADLNLAEMLEDGILQVSPESRRAQLQLVLNLLETPLFNWLTVRRFARFSEMDLATRTKVLHAWADSNIHEARQWFQGLKRLALFLTYSIMPDGKPNPAWPCFAYDRQPHRAEVAPHPITPLVINQPITLYTDVLVIGSGAGGGVIAGELTATGKDVIVVEKGDYFADHELHGRELDSQTMFERQGALTTADLSMSVLAGSTFGGGTTINWSASLRTPDDVLHEWETDYGFTGASGADFQKSLDAVCQRMNVSTTESMVNGNNGALEAGCKALGYSVTPIPRNVKGCEGCDYCSFGCSFGAKQGTVKTYLQDAHDRGARILVKAYVRRVLIERGVAIGAELNVQNADGQSYRVTVRAKYIVVAAGAIHTPAVLLRSGLTNANIGANLHLHPVTVIYGEFEEPVYPWHGPPMTHLTTQFANLDGRGYGVRLECAPVHPGIAAASLPWQSGEAHKRLMAKLHHLADIIVLTRDYYGGRVTLDGHGEPVLHYKLHSYDARHLMHGMLEALKIHLAAGAVEVSSPHNRQLVYRPGNPLSEGGINAFLDAVKARGFQPNAYSLFSAHQMSSCRIGGDSQTGAVDPGGETYEVRNLFVADASVLPTASGVNPMVSIMGMAHYLAQHMKSRM